VIGAKRWSNKTVQQNPFYRLEKENRSIAERLTFRHYKQLIQTFNPDTTSVADALLSAAMGEVLPSQASSTQDVFLLLELRSNEFVFPI